MIARMLICWLRGGCVDGWEGFKAEQGDFIQ